MCYSVYDMPRVNIYFTDKTLDELRDYIKKRYDGHRAMSMIVQRAVVEFLRRGAKSND